MLDRGKPVERIKPEINEKPPELNEKPPSEQSRREPVERTESELDVKPPKELKEQEGAEQINDPEDNDRETKMRKVRGLFPKVRIIWRVPSNAYWR